MTTPRNPPPPSSNFLKICSKGHILSTSPPPIQAKWTDTSQASVYQSTLTSSPRDCTRQPPHTRIQRNFEEKRNPTWVVKETMRSITSEANINPSEIFGRQANESNAQASCTFKRSSRHARPRTSSDSELYNSVEWGRNCSRISRSGNGKG